MTLRFFDRRDSCEQALGKGRRCEDRTWLVLGSCHFWDDFVGNGAD